MFVYCNFIIIFDVKNIARINHRFVIFEVMFDNTNIQSYLQND